MILLHHGRFETLCQIAIEQTDEHFHAHVELDPEIEIGPGDRVQVHGPPVSVPFGSSALFERTATIERATLLGRTWTRVAAYFDLSELYEVSFSPRWLG